jgi:hypothetical protein
VRGRLLFPRHRDDHSLSAISSFREFSPPEQRLERECSARRHRTPSSAFSNGPSTSGGRAKCLAQSPSPSTNVAAKVKHRAKAALHAKRFRDTLQPQCYGIVTIGLELAFQGARLGSRLTVLSMAEYSSLEQEAQSAGLWSHLTSTAKSTDVSR